MAVFHWDLLYVYGDAGVVAKTILLLLLFYVNASMHAITQNLLLKKRNIYNGNRTKVNVYIGEVREREQRLQASMFACAFLHCLPCFQFRSLSLSLSLSLFIMAFPLKQFMIIFQWGTKSFFVCVCVCERGSKIFRWCLGFSLCYFMSRCINSFVSMCCIYLARVLVFKHMFNLLNNTIL